MSALGYKKLQWSSKQYWINREQGPPSAQVDICQQYFSIYGLHFGIRTKVTMDKGYNGQRLEWTKVRTGENAHCATNFNKTKIQCEHSFEGSD